MNWLISNRSLKEVNGLEEVFKASAYSLYSTKPDSVIRDEDKYWIEDGHVLSRKSVEIDGEGPLSPRANKQFKEKFIHKLKGNNIIIRMDNNGFRIWSDRFAVKKFFVWENGNEFIISNDLKLISQQVSLEPSETNMAFYAVTYHFCAGTTAFKNTSHNIPGEVLTFDGNGIEKDTYWNPESLINLEKSDISINEISQALVDAVESTFGIIAKDKISLSLTGGADTRNLLAIFMKLGIKPHLYTYGNPESADCSKALKISSGLGLKHKIHDIKMTSSLFSEYARKISKLSGGLASIHRAHRLIAVERENPEAEHMYLGTLGGEYIKGVSQDNYIVPPVVYDNWEKQGISREDLQTYFKDRRINKESLNSEEFLEILNKEPYMIGSVNLKKHNSLSYITAHLHDAQDVNLYNSAMEYVFTPFLDVDYMEILFRSKFTFDVKEEISNTYIKKLSNPLYSSQFLRATYPPLTKYRHAGEHRPNEVLFNKFYAGFMKIIRKKMAKTYPANFPLGKWMADFVGAELPGLKSYEVINKVFDVDKLIEDFNKNQHKTNESYWLRFTNPIMMKYIIDEFAGN